MVWTAENGKITGRYHPGKAKGCVVCGRQLRARYWQGYGPILAAAATLHRVACSDAEWRQLSPKLRKAGHQALPVPVEGGRIVYNTAELGEEVTDLPAQFLADLLAMTNDARRMRATGSKEHPGWRQAWQKFAQATKAPKGTGEHVGFSAADSIPRAFMWAHHFGLLERDLGGEGLVIRDVRESDPATWYFFAERVGIRKRAPAAARAAAV